MVGTRVVFAAPAFLAPTFDAAFDAPAGGSTGAVPVSGSRTSSNPSGFSITLSGNAVATSYASAGRARSSRFLNRSHASCRSPGFAMRTSSHRPASFSPCSANTSLPAASPARGSPTGSHVPRSHTITVPAPYCLSGIRPSKLPYDTG